MAIEKAGGGGDFDFSDALIVGEETEGADGGGLEAMAGFAAFKLAEVGVEDAGATSLDQAVEEAPVQDVVDAVATVMATHSAIAGIAADKLADFPAVPQLPRNHKRIASLKRVFWMAAAGENLLGGLLREGFSGGDWMAGIGDAAQAERTVLADDAGDAPAPDVANAVIHGEIRMIGWVAWFITVTFHDVGTEIGDGLGMIDPDGDLAVVLYQFVERAADVAASGREIAV